MKRLIAVITLLAAFDAAQVYRVINIAATTLLFTGIAAIAQAPKTAEVTVKSTPASDALVEFAKSQSADQKAYNAKLQQARFNLDNNNKTLNEQMQALQKDLQAKLQQDKKYKPMLDQITDLQKKMSEPLLDGWS